MSSGTFNLMFNFISEITRLWNLVWFINVLKSWEDSVLVGVVLTICSFEKCSECRSWIFLVVQN